MGDCRKTGAGGDGVGRDTLAGLDDLRPAAKRERECLAQRIATN